MGAENVQNFSDVVPVGRESKYKDKGDQFQVTDIIGKTLVLRDAVLDSDDNSKWADVFADVNDQPSCFVTSSKPLVEAIEKILDGKLFDIGPIKTVVVRRSSRDGRNQYYVFE